MKVVTVDEMKCLEDRCAAEGITTDMLMEKAGLSVAEEIRSWRGGVAGSSILVLVGPGNNGGDGLVAGRHLHDWGAGVNVYLCAPRKDADANLKEMVKRGIDIFDIQKDAALSDLRRLLSSSEVVLDAVLGTGRARPIEGALKGALETVAEARRKRPGMPLIALDIPTGLDADSGTLDPACPGADITIALGYPKTGLLTFPGVEMVGKLVVTDIGIPPHLSEGVSLELITPEWVKSVLPSRPLSAHKGTFGRVIIVAGSNNYIGAAYLACMGAARVGAGLVTLATARSLQPILASKMTEVTYLPLAEAEPGIIDAKGAVDLLQQFGECKALVVGCGLGQHPSTTEFLKEALIKEPHRLPPAILDADALNILAGVPQWWEKLPSQVVLTPHPGEMSRLMDASVSQVQSRRIQISRETAFRWGKIVLLKGAYSVVSDPEGKAKLSPYANPGLASAGTGDVLAGIVGGLMCQGLSPFEAAACGVYLHGAAGEAVSEEMGDAGMLASDLLPVLPKVIKRLKENPSSE